MSYDLELGYAKRMVGLPSGYRDVEGFEVASVRPFRGGGTVPVDPEAGLVNKELDIAPYEYGVDIRCVLGFVRLG